MARMIVQESHAQTEKDIRKRSDTFEISIMERMPDGTKKKIATHAIEFSFVPPTTTRVVVFTVSPNSRSKSTKPLYVDRSAPHDRIDAILRSCVHAVCSASRITVDRLKRENERQGLPPIDVDVYASWSLLDVENLDLPFDASTYTFASHMRQIEGGGYRSIAVEQMLDACKALLWI